MLNSYAAHQIAEVFARSPLLHFLPARGTVDGELIERTNQHGILADFGMLAKLVGEADATLLVESERERSRKKPCKRVLRVTICQRLLRSLFVKFVHLSRRQNRDITVGMRRREERIALRVRRPPRRRNRQAILVVEGVPIKAGVKRFAELSHRDATLVAPMCPISTQFHPQQSSKLP